MKPAQIFIIATLALLAVSVIWHAQSALEAVIPLALLALALFLAFRYNPFITGQIKSERVSLVILAIGVAAIAIKYLGHFFAE